MVKATTVEPFQWTSHAQKAFEELKHALSTASVLALPTFKLPFTVETDALGVGMGAVLSQKAHPIAFFSKPFTLKLMHTSTYVRELAAITTAVKKWRQYLLGHHFTIITDHRSLKELLNQIIQTPEQHMYLARLMGYDYDIQYCSGSHNQAVDALSHLPELDPSTLLIISVPCFTFMKELRCQLDDHPYYQRKLQKVLDDSTKHPEVCVS